MYTKLKNLPPIQKNDTHETIGANNQDREKNSNNENKEEGYDNHVDNSGNEKLKHNSTTITLNRRYSAIPITLAEIVVVGAITGNAKPPSNSEITPPGGEVNTGNNLGNGNNSVITPKKIKPRRFGAIPITLISIGIIGLVFLGFVNLPFQQLFQDEAKKIAEIVVGAITGIVVLALGLIYCCIKPNSKLHDIMMPRNPRRYQDF